ncbi:type VII secretion target [Actinosynnema mirum]|uniref:ESX-1 secretion-associated protein EspA/EspE-like domain-containing protein n=2 Tax=Actinosynnema TaxID=40566 RepID=C6WHF8_ACTMD|nr:type VII secretion target [Actinosynnema mirum]ACU38077.1 hypothetical protein Amir_4222 [Actinosynnema mirum DSM 43827]AXX31569.1 hypothetical protein APASM_4204 [Actinosynnema pretiosum subsp. pretiosum]
MGDGFGVHTGEMREHAGRLEGVVDQIDVAKDAATQATISGTTAYGILCSPLLLPLMGSVEAMGHTAISTARTVVNATAEGIVGMADTYDAVEAAVIKGVETIEKALDGIR